jgi:hypothetical protein
MPLTSSNVVDDFCLTDPVTGMLLKMLVYVSYLIMPEACDGNVYCMFGLYGDVWLDYICVFRCIMILYVLLYFTLV